LSRAERQLQEFVGAWRLERTIAQADLPPGRFEGTALWSPHPEGLAYLEDGTLWIEGQPPMIATRRYLWKPDLSVWFEDGRYFHTVPPAGGDTAHWCDPDDYRVEYDFTRWPAFEVHWRVQGPRKSYEMRSQYTRA
jgi:hypothetical protein